MKAGNAKPRNFLTKFGVPKGTPLYSGASWILHFQVTESPVRKGLRQTAPEHFEPGAGYIQLAADSHPEVDEAGDWPQPHSTLLDHRLLGRMAIVPTLQISPKGRKLWFAALRKTAVNPKLPVGPGYSHS